MIEKSIKNKTHNGGKKTMETGLYTVREAARLLTLKESTIYRWIFDRKIQPRKIGTRAVRIPQSEIERILNGEKIEKVAG